MLQLIAKRLLPLLLLTGLFSLSAVAQPQAPSEQQMQQMMQRAAEMQACFAKVDPAKMQALMDQGTKMESEIRGLCQQGKRTAAQAKAMKFGLEMSASSELKELRACGEMMADMLPPMLSDPVTEEGDGEDGHVCDGY